MTDDANGHSCSSSMTWELVFATNCVMEVPEAEIVKLMCPLDLVSVVVAGTQSPSPNSAVDPWLISSTASRRGSAPNGDGPVGSGLL